MSVFGSPSFWVIFGVHLAVGLDVILRQERARSRCSGRNHAVQPHQKPKLIVTDIGHDAVFNKVTSAHHMTTDRQQFAKLFVPSRQKE